MEMAAERDAAVCSRNTFEALATSREDTNLQVTPLDQTHGTHSCQSNSNAMYTSESGRARPIWASWGGLAGLTTTLALAV